MAQKREHHETDELRHVMESNRKAASVARRLILDYSGVCDFEELLLHNLRIKPENPTKQKQWRTRIRDQAATSHGR